MAFPRSAPQGSDHLHSTCRQVIQGNYWPEDLHLLSASSLIHIKCWAVTEGLWQAFTIKVRASSFLQSCTAGSTLFPRCTKVLGIPPAITNEGSQVTPKCWYLGLISIVSCRTAPSLCLFPSVTPIMLMGHEDIEIEAGGGGNALGSAKMGHRRPQDPGAGKCGRTCSCASQVKSTSLSAAEGTTSSGGCVQQQCLAGC